MTTYKRHLVYSVSLAMVFFSGLFCSMVAASEPLTPVVFEFCYENRAVLPYYEGSGDEVPTDKPGINILALRALDEAMDGIKIIYRREPWKRCLSSIETGKVDGSIASYYKSREAVGIYPKVNGKLDVKRKFSSASYCLFKSAKSLIDWNGKTYLGHGIAPVAVPRGYSIINQLNTHNVLYIEVKSNEEGFNLLANKRVDGMTTLCEAGRRLINANPQQYGRLVIDTPTLARKSAYLIVSKPFYRQHKALAEQMWKQLAQLDVMSY